MAINKSAYTCNRSSTDNHTTCVTLLPVVDIRIIWWIDITMSVLAIFFHSLGLFAIYTCKKRSNQRIILSSLSIAEMVGAIYMLINDIVRQVRYQDNMYDSLDKMEEVLANKLPPIYQEISFCVYLAAGFELILVLLIMTVDRLICAANPYAYSVHATGERLKMVICTSVVISLCLGLLYSLLPESKFYILALFLFVAVATLLLMVITYTLIGFKIRASKKSRSNNASVTSTRSERGNIRVRKHYMIPGLILLTYFTFYLVPSSVQQFALRRSVLTPNICVIHEGLAVLLVFGILSDALIYEFLIKDYRNVILKKIWYVCCGKAPAPQPNSSMISMTEFVQDR